jgi:NAD(P)-dependent dehydrogenase (short-subunit alcohol dehydrogenase family)
VVGKGLCRGLLRAGATVIVNSRSSSRLHALSEELGHPQNLMTIHGSMLPAGAESTTQQAMDITGGRLDHVVAHSGVRWWDSSRADESSTVAPSSRLLALSAEEFATFVTPAEPSRCASLC